MEEKIGFIYCIINKVNGKLYIGQTSKTIEERYNNHVVCANCNVKNKTVIQRAILKYNVGNFKVIKLWEGKLNIINDKEVYYIKLFDSQVPNGYNVAEGGKGARGYKMSEKARSNIRKAHVGIKLGEHLSKEHAEKIKRANRIKTTYKFFHPQYGLEEVTKYELEEKYNIKRGALNKLCSGNSWYFKEWNIINIKEILRNDT